VPNAIHMLDPPHKSVQAQRTKAVMPLVKAARRAVLLSGTPALNKPQELVPLLQVRSTSAHLHVSHAHVLSMHETSMHQGSHTRHRS
jgi:hypothetical protein